LTFSAALGFAAVENVKYFTDLRLETNIVAARSFMSVPGHMFFGAIWGYALGRKLVRKKTSVFGFFILAALAHASFDAFLSFPGGFLVGIGVMVALALGFIAMLRAALRHGTIEAAPPGRSAAAEPPPSKGRLAFRVGGPVVFYASTFALIILAVAVIHTGSAYEEIHRRATTLFLAIVTLLLSAFGLAIYFVSTTIPLDVVLDASGVTFAGARTEWARIRGIDRRHVKGLFGHRGWLTLHAADGPLRIGPAPSARIDEIGRALDSYVRSRAEEPPPQASAPPGAG
jgi:RsiW-degrading membrane proteinase PrsW (M82 family)